MTDKTDIAALREAALKATPGNWKLGIGSTYAYVQAAIDMKLGGRSWVKLCHLGRAGWRNQQSTIDDARFIALANPATIIALLDQLEAERQRLELVRGQRDNELRTNSQLEAELAALNDKHAALRESMAAIHNTIRGSGGHVSLSVLLSVSENAWRASAPIAKGTEKPQCDKCGGRGAYHCPQMLGIVECECGITPVFTAPQNPDVTNEMALAFHFATTDGAAADDDVEDIKIGLRAALTAVSIGGSRTGLIDALAAIKPKFGAPGSRDVDVRAARDAIDKTIEKLSNL